MPVCEITISNKLGLHARAAAKFIRLATSFSCQVKLGRSQESLVDGKNIMSVMMLAAGQGTTLWLSTDGDQAEQALKELVALVDDKFGEGQ